MVVGLVAYAAHPLSQGMRSVGILAVVNRKKDFQQRDGECSYCEFDGKVIVFENTIGEEVEVCGGCLEEALEELNDDFEPRGY